MLTATLLVTSPTGEVQRIQVAKPQLTVGRSSLNDVVIRDHAVSRMHACLEFGANGTTLRDLGSANGTLLNGAPVTAAPVTEDDAIVIGGHTLQFTADSPEVNVDFTRVGTMAEFDQTMIASPLESIVNDTSVPRLVITTPLRTWEVPLRTDVTVIGRGAACDVTIESPKVSRKHAQVERTGDDFQVRDLGSSNGTWLAGRRVERELLRGGSTFTIGDARCVFKGGFESDDLTILERPARQRKRKPVVIVPGMMGSNLYLGSQQVWPNVKLMLTDPDIFRYPGKTKLEARGLVTEVVVIPNLVKQDQYNRLTEYLSEELAYEPGVDLLEFAYDWRQDVRLTARELGAAIERWAPDEPITIIAHSLGSLVSRYYVDCLGGSKRIDRIVFLGAPHYGVPKSVVVLLEGPGLLPFGILNGKGRDILSTFPSVYQILPLYAAVHDRKAGRVDVLADGRWLPERQQTLHALASEFRRELPERCSASSVSIFGYGLKTVTSVSMDRNAQGLCLDVDYTCEDLGDTGLPQVTSALEGGEIHPVRQHHGALYTDKDVQMRLKLELTR